MPDNGAIFGHRQTHLLPEAIGIVSAGAADQFLNATVFLLHDGIEYRLRNVGGRGADVERVIPNAGPAEETIEDAGEQTICPKPIRAVIRKTRFAHRVQTGDIGLHVQRVAEFQAAGFFVFFKASP